MSAIACIIPACEDCEEVYCASCGHVATDEVCDSCWAAELRAADAKRECEMDAQEFASWCSCGQHREVRT